MKTRSIREIFELSFYPICFLLGLFWGLPLWGALDFSSFYASGLSALAGDNPYGIHPLTFQIETVWFSGYNHNLNPPTALPLFQLLALLPLETAFLVWWAISFLCAGLLFRVLHTEYGDRMNRAAIWWLLSMGALWDTLHLGQIYLPLALASAVAWTRLRHNKGAILTGILIGIVVAIKPNFLVWPVLLLLSGNIRVSLATFASAVLLSLGAAAMYGPGAYMHWVELLAGDGARAVFPTNGSLTGILARMGFPDVGRIMSIALLAAVGIWAFMARPHLLKVSAVALLVSLLASPIGWGQYSLFLAPILISLWHRRGALGVAASIALALPMVFIVWTPPNNLLLGMTFGSFYFWAFLAILILVLRTDDFETPPERQTAKLG